MTVKISCPIPVALTQPEARKYFNEVRVDMPQLSEAAHKREASRRAGLDYIRFTRALSGNGKSS